MGGGRGRQEGHRVPHWLSQMQARSWDGWSHTLCGSHRIGLVPGHLDGTSRDFSH